MAFYYPWWEPTDWTYDRMSDLAAPTYSGGERATLERHVQQADDAGIDALICAWFGPDDERINARCRLLMDIIEASGRDLKVTIMPEQAVVNSLKTVDGLASALDYLKREFMNRPSYQRVEGKPTLFWFYPESLGGFSDAESLALFGYPISEPAVETNSSGDTVQTQWFERARFEYHPNNPDPFKVLLGLLGNETR